MFALMLNTCAIPDGIVSYSATTKCPQCQQYSHAVFYSVSALDSSESSIRGPAPKLETKSSSNSTSSSSGLPDIVISHPPLSPGRPTGTSQAALFSNLEEHPELSSASPSGSGDKPERNFRRWSNAISRRRNPSAPSGSRDYDDGELGPAENEALALRSTCLENSSAPPSGNQIDYVHVGLRLRLIADNFQSKQGNGTVSAAVVMQIFDGRLLRHSARYLSFGIVGFLILHMIKSI